MSLESLLGPDAVEECWGCLVTLNIKEDSGHKINEAQ